MLARLLSNNIIKAAGHPKRPWADDGCAALPPVASVRTRGSWRHAAHCHAAQGVAGDCGRARAEHDTDYRRNRTSDGGVHSTERAPTRGKLSDGNGPRFR